MSSIAGKVGGSKTTLWTYFPSKEDLFAAVVDDIVASYGQALQIDLPVDEPVTDVLGRFGHVLMATLMSPALLALYRLVVAEAERFPHLAETFYDRGPRRGKARLAEWMAEKMARGELRPGDPIFASQASTSTQCSACPKVVTTSGSLPKSTLLSTHFTVRGERRCPHSPVPAIATTPTL